MCNQCKGRACEAQPAKQVHFNANSTVILQLRQLIQLAQWLHDECHLPETNSKTIIREFFKKLNEIRRSGYD